METFQIDRTKLQPIIDAALHNGRRIDLSKLTKEEWLGLRNILGLGASDISAALGLNKFKTAYELWKNLVSDEIIPIRNKRMRAGILTEEPIAIAYAEDCNREVINPHAIYIHPEHGCLFATPDRIIKDNGDGNGDGVLQCKKTMSYVYKSWVEKKYDPVSGEQLDEETQSIPLMYYIQVQDEMACTGLNWGVLALYISDTDDFIYVPLKRDQKFIDMMVKAAVLWYNTYVVTNEAPPPTSYEWDHYDPVPKTSVEADDDILKIIDAVKEKQKEAKILDEEIDSLKNKVKEFVGENELLKSGENIVVTYKTIHKAEYTVKAGSYRMLKFIKDKK